MFREADFNSMLCERRMDSDREAGVPRDPVHRSAEQDIKRFRIDSGYTQQIFEA